MLFYGRDDIFDVADASNSATMIHTLQIFHISALHRTRLLHSHQDVSGCRLSQLESAAAEIIPFEHAAAHVF